MILWIGLGYLLWYIILDSLIEHMTTMSGVLYQEQPNLIAITKNRILNSKDDNSVYLDFLMKIQNDTHGIAYCKGFGISYPASDRLCSISIEINATKIRDLIYEQ
jgi:hypothetical protein